LLIVMKPDSLQLYPFKDGFNRGGFDEAGQGSACFSDELFPD
jgi:hypothetical protein